MRQFFFIIIQLFLSGHILLSQQNYLFEKLPFCSDKNNEMGGVWYNDWLVFSADYSGRYAIYKNKTDSNFVWNAPVVFSDQFMIYTNDGPPVFRDSTKLYYTMYVNSPEKILDGVSASDEASINYHYMKKGKWSKNKKSFIYNGIKCFVGHPAFDKENNRIYFSADFQDSKGGADIYSCGWINNDWAEPINMGKLINSDKDELFPYYADGYLYYASNGSQSKGGFDIFRSKYVNGEWTEPEQLESPINTEFNDFAPVVCNDLTGLIFTSDRDGSMDIFSYQTEIPFPENCDINHTIQRCIHVIEEGSEMQDNSTFVYTWDMGDGNTVTGNDFDYCYKKDGKYYIQLNVYDKLTGEFTEKAANYEITMQTEEYLLFEIPDTISVNEELKSRKVENTYKTYQNSLYLWNIDGKIFFGDSLTYKFSAPGEYMVALGIYQNKFNISMSQNHCVYKKIVVTE